MILSRGGALHRLQGSSKVIWGQPDIFLGHRSQAFLGVASEKFISLKTPLTLANTV